MLTVTPPLDPQTNLLWRAFAWRACDKSRRAREQTRERCRHDLDFFTNSFVWQFNPGKIGREVGPFILRPRQSQVLERTAKRLFNTDGLRLDMTWEKSREEGASWMALILFVHRCLFWSRQKFLCVSHTADAVDKPGDPDSLFWKIDFIHEYLPEWMLGAVDRTKMKFVYGNTKSAITGAASTGRSGVGGRATAVLLDELGKQVNADEIIGQTADTGPRLMVSTHYGPDTPFYRQTVRPDVAKELMHWSHNPEKARGLYRYDGDNNRIEVLDKTHEFPPDYPFVMAEAPTGGPFPGLRSPWYDAECVRRASPRDIAQHLDIDPLGSQTQFFNALTIHQLIRAHCREPLWEGELSYDEDAGKPLRLVERPGGIIKLWQRPLADGRLVRAPYGCGCDISAGSGATNSVAAFGNANTGEKVAEIATAHMRPEKFAPLVVAMCRLLLDEEDVPAKLVWETPGPGATFGDLVFALNFTNIHYREPAGGEAVKSQTSKIPGWHNQPQQMLTLFEHYRGALDGHQFINRSRLAMEETLKYRYTSTGVEHPGSKTSDDPSGARVNHGDRVVADALLWKMMRALNPNGSASTIAEQETPRNSIAGRRENRRRELQTASGW